MLRYDTYEEYLIKKLENKEQRMKNDKWIYDILNGTQEKNEYDVIIYENYDCVLLPTRQWIIKNKKSLKKLYLVAFVKDTSISSLRDLNASHIDMLKNICDGVLIYIEQTYGVSKKSFKPYIHYYPSTWLLHIHFNSVPEERQTIHPIYYVEDVIKNLEYCSTYYKEVMTVCEKINLSKYKQK